MLYWLGQFALITNIERFLYDITRVSVKNVFCLNCFGHFLSELAFDRHQVVINRPNFTNTNNTFAPPGTPIKFMKLRLEKRVPFVILADCEAVCTLTP